MAAKAERQALLFLAAVALLGAGTRACRARQPAANPEALDRQISAVESSRTEGRGRSGRPRKTAKPKGEKGPRRDSAIAPIAAAGPARPLERLDLDRARETEIDRLPGIGPAIARRIVADRDARGAFGCLRALDAVKGIGPALIRRLDTLVVFSGVPRPDCTRN